MSDASFSKVIKQQIIECRWPDVAERWLQYLPKIDPPGSAPTEGLSEFIGFTQVAADIDNYEIPHKQQVDGLREYLFREGVFLLHKAMHVSGCAENQAKVGYKTWSLPEAYQSALFAAKAILGFAGIGLAEYNSKAVLVDIFPKEEDTQKRRSKLKLQLLDDPAIQFTKLNMRFEHRHVWSILKRMLAVYQMSRVWPEEYISALRNVDANEFAKQRNELNYKNQCWIFEDIHNPVIDESFGIYNGKIEESVNYSLESSFSVTIAILLMRLAILQFTSISANTSLMNEEIKVVTANLSVERHPLFLDAFPAFA